jgi:membrane-associated phospholipid phosphatase
VKRLLVLLFLVSTWLRVGAQSADLRLLIALNKNSYPVWDNVMWGTSATVYLTMPLVVVTPYLDGFYHKLPDKKRAAVLNAAGITLALTTSAAIKFGVRRIRPKAAHPAEIIERDHAGPLSFPSGHTTAAFASATAISLTYRKWYVIAPAYLYAGLTGYSRMRLGMHYPTDVLAGAVIGAGSMYLLWKIEERLQKKKSVKLTQHLYE